MLLNSNVNKLLISVEFGVIYLKGNVSENSNKNEHRAMILSDIDRYLTRKNKTPYILANLKNLLILFCKL